MSCGAGTCTSRAANHYTRLFADSRILATQRAADGRVTTVTFELAGQRYVAYDGGPRFTFTGAVSLYAECDTQEEVDELWAGLADGGQEGPGGSLTDRFGVSWQVMPKAVGALLAGRSRAGPDRAARHAEDRHPGPGRRARRLMTGQP